jgi:hypothetical protein
MTGAFNQGDRGKRALALPSDARIGSDRGHGHVQASTDLFRATYLRRTSNHPRKATGNCMPDTCFHPLAKGGWCLIVTACSVAESKRHKFKRGRVTRTSVVPFGSILPDPPPTRCIARRPWPANHGLEGSPVEGADAISDRFGSSEPSEFRSAFLSFPGNRGPSLFLGGDGFTVQRRRPGLRSWFRQASLATLGYASRNQFRGPPQSGHRNLAALHNSTRLMVWTRPQSLHFWRQVLGPRVLCFLPRRLFALF